MANIKLIVEYDGAGFYGWQKQPELRTVQSELEKVIETVVRGPISPLHAAGRTDSGVHARGQVVTFKTDMEVDTYRLAQGISHLMRGELAVVSAEIVPDGFHPGWCSTHKQYSYRILTRPAPAVLDARRVWHIPHRMDLDQLRESASVVVGTHDFSGFRDSTCTAASPIKTIFSSSFSLEGDLLIYRVVGDGFLKQMVRNLVGTMTDLARGRLRGRSMRDVLESRDRRRGGVTAPAYGLCMDWVSYEPLPASGAADGESSE